MSWIFITFIFLASCVALAWSASRLVDSLIHIAKYLRWREFIVAFFVMAFATSLGDFFLVISASLQQKPELALGNILGGNLVDLTLVLAIAVFFSKKGLSAESNMVQQSAIFTAAIAVLPLLLILDRNLSRIDGIILIFAFFVYAWWIFSNSERFKKIYHEDNSHAISSFKSFLKSLVKITFFVGVLILSSQAIISSAQFFASSLGVSLALVGVLIVGLGNSVDEGYFAIASARRNANWLVLGNLMGGVVICATLVLGVVALLFPFEIHDFSPFLTARIFLIIAAFFSLLFIRSGKELTKKEGLILLFVYIAFLITEIFVR